MRKIIILLLTLSSISLARPVVRSSSRVSRSVSRTTTRTSKPRVVKVKPKTTTHKATVTKTKSTPRMKTSTVSSAPKSKKSFLSSNYTSSTSSPVVVRDSGSNFFSNYLMFRALSGTNRDRHNDVSNEEFIRILEAKLKRLRDEKNPENLVIIRHLEELLKTLKNNRRKQ